jgi:ribosomal-protein-alanine N-acetyltransferase
MKHPFDFKIIETERLQLREVSPRVYDHLFGNYSDVYIKKFFGLTTKEEFAQERYRYEAGLQSFNKSYFYFHIIEKTSGRVIGSIGYHTWYTQHDRAEIFYNIRHENDRRKGYVKEALPAVIAYGFRDMSLNRIEAFLSDRNTASVKLMQYAGFIKEGVLKGHYLVNGVYEDSDVYGLLRNAYHDQI